MSVDEHRELYDQAAGYLAMTAGKLRCVQGEVKLDAGDVAGLFVATGFNVLAHELGQAAAVEYLRYLAGQFETGGAGPLNN